MGCLCHFIPSWQLAHGLVTSGHDMPGKTKHQQETTKHAATIKKTDSLTLGLFKLSLIANEGVAVQLSYGGP